MGSSTGASTPPAPASSAESNKPSQPQQEQQQQSSPAQQPASKATPGPNAPLAPSSSSLKDGAAGSPSEGVLVAPPPSTATATAAKEKMGARAATTTASSTEASAAAPASVPSGGYDPSRRYRLRRTGVIGSREKIPLPWHEEGKAGVGMVIGRTANADEAQWMPGTDMKLRMGLVQRKGDNQRWKEKLGYISRKQATLRVDTPTGRFLLRNEGKHAAVLLKRCAAGWGGALGEVVLKPGDNKQEAELRVGDTLQLDTHDQARPEATWRLEQDDDPIPTLPSASLIKTEKDDAASVVSATGAVRSSRASTGSRASSVGSVRTAMPPPAKGVGAGKGKGEGVDGEALLADVLGLGGGGKAAAPTKNKQSASSKPSKKPRPFVFEVGQTVVVAERRGAGKIKEGGVARITAVHSSDSLSKYTYDVRYIQHGAGRGEKGLDGGLLDVMEEEEEEGTTTTKTTEARSPESADSSNKKRPSPTSTAAGEGNGSSKRRQLRARREARGGKQGEEAAAVGGKGTVEKGGATAAANRLRKAQAAAKLGAEKAMAEEEEEEEEEEDWSDGGGGGGEEGSEGMLMVEEEEEEEDGRSLVSVASSVASKGTKGSKGKNQKGPLAKGRCVFCGKEFGLRGPKDQEKLTAHTQACQRVAAKRAKEEAMMVVMQGEEEEEEEEEEEMAVDPTLEGLANRNSTGSATTATGKPSASSAAAAAMEEGGVVGTALKPSAASAAAALPREEEEEEEEVVLPEGFVPEEIPSGLVSSLSANLTVQDPSFVLGVLEEWASHTYHMRPATTASSSSKNKKPAGRLPPLRLVPEILHANGASTAGKGLLRTHCPLRAQSFARMLHRTQRTFPAHMTPGAWRLADVRLLNTVMAGVYDKDPRKARSRALALGWLEAVFAAEAAGVRCKAGTEEAEADRALAASILGSLMDSSTAAGSKSTTTGSGGLSSAGIRAETRGAVDVALHVCAQPQVLQSATGSRTATLQSAPGKAGKDPQRWLLWAEGAEALAARFTPRFALLALEAYGALLRTKYGRENATAQQPAVELVEKSLDRRAQAVVAAMEQGGKGSSAKAAANKRAAERRLGETKEALRRAFYRPLPPPAARRLLGPAYAQYEQAALGPLSAQVRAFEEGK